MPKKYAIEWDKTGEKRFLRTGRGKRECFLPLCLLECFKEGDTAMKEKKKKSGKPTGGGGTQQGGRETKLRNKLLLTIIPAVIVMIVVLVAFSAVLSRSRLEEMATAELESSVQNQGGQHCFMAGKKSGRLPDCKSRT